MQPRRQVDHRNAGPLTRRVALLTGRLGLTRIAFSVWERYRALREGRHGQNAAADGLPLPSALDMVQVVGKADPDKFLASGAAGADEIRRILAGQGTRLEDLETILDFGCGCGRIARHWSTLKPNVSGCDYNKRLIAWCQRSLPFLSVAVNDFDPPAPFADETFDLVYAISVFSHLTEPRQHAWLRDLRRMLRPGGWLLFTVQGDEYRAALDRPERRAYGRMYDSGQLVITDGDAEGTNRCSAYHPHRWVVANLTTGFEFADFVPAASEAFGYQDAYLLRRLAVESSSLAAGSNMAAPHSS